MQDAYTIYCEHMKAMGWPCPSREWWDLACSKRKSFERQNEIQADYDQEDREGWFGLEERNRAAT